MILLYLFVNVLQDRILWEASEICLYYRSDISIENLPVMNMFQYAERNKKKIIISIKKVSRTET